MRDSASPERQSLTERPQWRSLTEHRGQIERLHLRELFAADPSRGERLAAEAAGLYLD
jgi:glucose-6-phosphate isomerase